MPKERPVEDSDEVQRGFTSIEAESWAEALSVFEGVLHRHPRDGRAYLGRGRAHYEQGEFELALDDFDKALQCGHVNAEVYRYRGRAHDKLQIYEEIADDFTRVLDFIPDDPEAFFERGNALDNLGDSEAALADYNEAMRLGVQHALIHVCRANTWRALDEPEKALADLEESLRRQPAELPNAAWYHNRAHTWWSFERHEQALADFAAASRLDPQSTYHYNCCANLLLDLGREEEADALFLTIQRLNLGEDERTMADNKTLIYPLAQEHFAEAPLEKINVTLRKWPFRAAADLQRAFDSLESAGFVIKHFYATQYGGQAAQEFTQVYNRDRRNPVIAVPPQYLEIDIGEEQPVRALKDGLWLLYSGAIPLIVLLNPDYDGIKVQVAALNGTPGVDAAHRFFHHLEEAIKKSECYRGKVLSLEFKEMYSGQGLGILVHKLRKVDRDEVILPRSTLDLLDRNVMQFVRQRPRLAALGLATKKGLLFYGPPGTGKTHTLHYLAATIPGHTTFLISAEQVGNLAEYITLARLLQPSMVVIEDVDLIARDRAEMRSAGEEVLLNKLLNEMDGLRQEAEILFVLTTNRPAALEEALASRPGRVDQAIEFPLPDAEGRNKLVRLYSQGVPVPEDVIQFTVERTDRVSASFIKELMRRAIQFALIRMEGEPRIDTDDIKKALDELLVSGGSLNRKLLGAIARDE
jgi:tetratricopeptide (TPR) repeat protein